MNELPQHVRRNRAHWDQLASNYVSAGEHGWAINQPNWVIWSVPESEVRMFPDDLDGKDMIELGCGTAYVSSWLARRGASVVGIDNSEQQLATARRLQGEHGLDFPLFHGNAEAVPYPDASFDFAISEYGAGLWADPYRWVPEAARLLSRAADCTSLLMLFCSHCVCRKTTVRQAINYCGRHSVCIALNGPRTTALSFISPTVIGSDCCDGPDSRSRIYSRFVRKQAQLPGIRSSTSSGHASGQAKKYGKPGDVRRIRMTVTGN